jgi:hypothetical protein
MSIIQPVLTPDQINEISLHVNNYRKINQAQPLGWDTTIQSFSQDWSYYLLQNNLFEHSGSKIYGENLAYFQGYGTDIMSLLKLAIDAWYNEIASYNFKKPGFSDTTGHFTCLVWAASKTYALGISINPANSAVIITMNTNPPGNINGEFQKNVLPIVNSTPSPTPDPPIPPIPIYNTVLLLKIINDIHNIIFSINRRRTKYVVVSYINNVISDLSTLTNIPIISSVIINLNIIIHTIVRIGYSKNVINSLNNIIVQLKQYL